MPMEKLYFIKEVRNFRSHEASFLISNLNIKIKVLLFVQFIFITQEKLRELNHETQKNLDAISKVTSFSYAIQSSADSSTVIQNLPDFPSDNLKLIARISDSNSQATAFDLIYRLYPFESFLPKESLDSLKTLFKGLRIDYASKSNNQQKITNVTGPTLSELHLSSGNNAVLYTGKSMPFKSSFLFAIRKKYLFDFILF